MRKNGKSKIYIVNLYDKYTYNINYKICHSKTFQSFLRLSSRQHFVFFQCFEMAKFFKFFAKKTKYFLQTKNFLGKLICFSKKKQTKIEPFCKHTVGRLDILKKVKKFFKKSLFFLKKLLTKFFAL